MLDHGVLKEGDVLLKKLAMKENKEKHEKHAKPDEKGRVNEKKGKHEKCAKQDEKEKLKDPIPEQDAYRYGLC